MENHVISPHSVRMRENTDQKNSECGRFLCSDKRIENTHNMLKMLLSHWSNINWTQF